MSKGCCCDHPRPLGTKHLGHMDTKTARRRTGQNTRVSRLVEPILLGDGKGIGNGAVEIRSAAASEEGVTRGGQGMTLSFTLPLGVSVNHMYVVTSHGVHLSDDARRFKKEATLIARNAAQLAGWVYPTGAGLSLSLALYMPSNRRADISNLIKATEDSIADALGFDDQCIQRILVERMGVDKQNPRCEVLLCHISEAN